MRLGLLAAVAAPTPLARAWAVTRLVSIAGEDSAAFEIHSNPAPDHADEFGLVFSSYPVIVPAGSQPDIIFSSKALDACNGGGIFVADLDHDASLINAVGPPLCSGSTSAPTVPPGTYLLIDPDFATL
jgi:hypothetical protein